MSHSDTSLIIIKTNSSEAEIKRKINESNSLIDLPYYGFLMGPAQGIHNKKRNQDALAKTEIAQKKIYIN